MKIRKALVAAAMAGCMPLALAPAATAAPASPEALIVTVKITGDCRTQPAYGAQHSGSVYAGHRYYWSGYTDATGNWFELYCNNNTWRWYPAANLE